MSAVRLAVVLLVLFSPGSRAGGTYVPSAPQNLRFVNVTSSEIHLSWAPPTTYTSPAFSMTFTGDEKIPQRSDIVREAAKTELPQVAPAVAVEAGEKSDRSITEVENKPQSLMREPDNEVVYSEAMFHDKFPDSDIEERYKREVHTSRRHRRRRQEASTAKTEVSKESIENTVDVHREKILENTHKSFAIDKERILEDTHRLDKPIGVVKKSPPIPKNRGMISYVLYYELGTLRDNTTAIAGVPSSEEIKNMNFFLSDMRMADYSSATKNLTLLNNAGIDTSAVGYRLKGLKSLTPYKIWVRAFYNFSLENATTDQLIERLGPRSEPIYVLTDVRAPSEPIVLNLTCDQPAGILYLQWRQPLFYENSLDQYVVSLRKLPEQAPRTRLTIPSNRVDVETSIGMPVELWNTTQYEVIIYAVTVSVVRENALITGNETKAEVVSQCRTRAVAAPEVADRASTLALVTAAMSLLLLAMLVYLVARCGCRSRISKCITAAYSFLEEGGERGARAPLKTYKKPVVGCSPLRNCTESTPEADAERQDGVCAAPSIGGEIKPPRMSSAAHRAVPDRLFPRHVAALHADGDIGFSKEYEIVVSRSAALAHTSHHSHRPENRHKNRYLNITAYDHSRVCVSSGGQCGAAGCAGGVEAVPCDYVNANFIDGILPALDEERKEYIRRKLKKSTKPHSRQPSQKITKPPPHLTEGIESAFLNIEFSGIVEPEAPQDSSSESEQEEDDDDRVTIDLDGQRAKVKLEWLVWRRRYIATQGPTPATLPAFWRMVWQHKVYTLVMITNLVERGRRKCDMYWPSGGRGSTAEFGGVHVTLLHEDVRAAYTVRHLRVKCVTGSDTGSGKSASTSSNGEDARTVVQYHYTVWPDHGTPAHPLAVLPFVKAASVAPHSVLVHCSAGVGRTGTYIVLDAQLSQLRLTGTAAPLGFLCRARTQRNHLVQTEEQYVFVHDALLEHVRSGETAVRYERAAEQVGRLLAPIPAGELDVLDVKPEISEREPASENGDAASASSTLRNGCDDASECQSERRDDESETERSDKRSSVAVSLKDASSSVNGVIENGISESTSATNGAPDSDAVYDLAPAPDSYNGKMAAYNSMSQAEKDELRRVNRAENYAILERMRSLAGRKQQVIGPPPVNLLEKQFQLITRCYAEPALASRAPHNQDKNRLGGVVPSDSARVMLVPRPGVEGSEYVNASWVTGRRRLREYAVSQHPNSAAIPDFWRLLWDHTAQLVLVLTDPDDTDCEIFWPTEEDPEFFAANFKASFINKEVYVAHRKCDRREPTPQPESEISYRRQENSDCADDEALIPENVTSSPEQNSVGYKYEKVELRLERLGSGGRDLAARKSIANGDLFSSLTERRSGPRSPRSPSKMSLKSFKLGSPTRFKFPDWGSRGGAGSPPDTAPPPPPVAPAATVEEEIELRRPCYSFERVESVTEDVASDRIVEVTNVSVHSLQDDYQLTVKIMRCSGWLEGDTVEYQSGKPDDNPFVKDLRNASTEAEKEEALNRLTEPYRDSFALIEFVAGRQMEYKNGPVVVVDKYGDWRSMSFCTLSAACGGARPADALPDEFRDPSDNAADIYCWAALAAHSRVASSPKAPVHSHGALLAQYAALERYARLLRAPR